MSQYPGARTVLESELNTVAVGSRHTRERVCCALCSSTMEVDSGSNPRGGVAGKQPLRAPLSSQRMTANWLRRIGSAIDLPTTAFTVELLQMIETKLTEQGHDSRNVQVVSKDGTPKSRISLQDEKGEFLVIEPKEEGELDDQQPSDSGLAHGNQKEPEGPGEIGVLALLCRNLRGRVGP